MNYFGLVRAMAGRLGWQRMKRPSGFVNSVKDSDNSVLIAIVEPLPARPEFLSPL